MLKILVILVGIIGLYCGAGDFGNATGGGECHAVDGASMGSLFCLLFIFAFVNFSLNNSSR